MDTILKRRVRPWPVRTVAFVDLQSGMFIHEAGRHLQCRIPVTLAKLLQVVAWEKWEAKPRIVYIVGGWNVGATPKKEWFHDVPGEWELTSYHHDPLSVDYRHVVSGQRVRCHMTAQWFGQCGDVEICFKAFFRLRDLLRSSFDQGVSLMGTPARTGLDLIERSLPCDKSGKPYEYPVLENGVRELLEHNVGQGRMEFFERSEKASLLCVLDAIWMYAACTRRMPVGELNHDDVQELADNGYRPGFYRVVFQVPENWQHIGLLPVWNGRPTWPCVSDGQWYESYACGEEVKLARENGWNVQIAERWLFADEKTPGADPLRTWTEKLRTLRAACTDEREGKLGKPLRDAIRALLIKAIGGLHRRGRAVLVETPIAESENLPEGAVLDEDVYGLNGDVIRWWRPVALDAAMAQFQHPEWACLIWGRARARLARMALSLPFGSIVALRTDAIVTTVEVRTCGDDKPGTFRLKERYDVPGGMLPRNDQEYLKLRRETTRG